MIDTILYWNVRALGSSKKRLKSLLMKNNVSIYAIARPFARENCMTTMDNFLSLNSLDILEGFECFSSVVLHCPNDHWLADVG